MGAMMLNNTSIKMSSFKNVWVSKGGGVKFDETDLSPAVLKI